MALGGYDHRVCGVEYYGKISVPNQYNGSIPGLQVLFSTFLKNFHIKYGDKSQYVKKVVDLAGVFGYNTLA